LDKNQEHLSQKYTNSQGSVGPNLNKSSSPIEVQNKKLRQAQFELNKLKAEIAKK